MDSELPQMFTVMQGLLFLFIFNVPIAGGIAGRLEEGFSILCCSNEKKNKKRVANGQDLLIHFFC